MQVVREVFQLVEVEHLGLCQPVRADQHVAGQRFQILKRRRLAFRRSRIGFLERRQRLGVVLFFDRHSGIDEQRQHARRV